MSQQSDPDNYSDIDPEYLQFYTPVYTSTTIISLVANTAVVGFHWLMAWYKVAEFNRVSLRLIVLASFFGIARSVCRLAMSVPADEVSCLVDTFFLGWSEIASPLCLAMVGVHAVSVLVLNVKNPLRQEKYYYLIIVLYSLVASLVTVTHRTRNFPEDFYCWVRFYFGSKQRQPFAWIWYYTMVLLPITLAALCSLILTIRYRMERHNFVETSVRYAQNNNPYLLPAIPTRRSRVDPIKTFRNLIIRSTFYALVPLISKIFLIISGMTSLLGYSTNFYALMIGGVVTNIQGLLISILYFSDPAVIFTIGRLGRFLRKVYVDEYQLPDDKPLGDVNEMESGPYDSDDLRTGDGSEDDIGGAIRLTHTKHDMIAAETSTMEPTHGYYDRDQHHYWKHQYSHHPQGMPPYYQRAKIDNTRKMKDPYRYRWLARTMHFFLTSLCRLKPTPPSTDSTSTLSYHSRSLSRISTIRSFFSSIQLATSSLCGSRSINETDSNTNSVNSIKSANTTRTTSTSSDKDRVPAVRVSFVTPDDNLRKQHMEKALSTSQATSNDNQQLLALPTKTATAPKLSVSPHDSQSSTHSRKHSHLASSSSLDSSGGQDLSAVSDAESNPMASSRFARQSKKLRQVMLHRHEINHTLSADPFLDSQKQQVSPLSPTFQDNSPSTSTRHLSVPSSEEDIDRLSLLSLTKSIEHSSVENYEPLSAPPYYYLHRRQQEQQQDMTTTVPTSTWMIPTPQLSITLPDEETALQDDNTRLSPSSTTIEWTVPPQQKERKLEHGVELEPEVLKTLLDWEPSNTFYPAYVDQLMTESDGLGYGYTNVIHIQQSWNISTLGIFENDDGSKRLSISDSIISSSSSGSNSSDGDCPRLVFFVEHWVKGYLGSRWFVVE